MTAQSCPTCGAPLDAPAGVSGAHSDLSVLLPAGTRLNNGSFSIGKLLGRGGFGITYLGADLRLKRSVAIKEFFPAGSVRHGKNVVLSGNLSPADYAAATQKFLQEAQVVARFRHPSIVNVYEVFQENQTAYMIMEYLEGETLMGRLERYGKPLSEAELIAVTGPVADALEEVHGAGVLHRDIKPQNIMLVGPENAVRPVLIDFGAAREFASGVAHRHSIVLTPGYAPLEQYGEHVRRGAFTDIYALAATLYHMATGEQPPAATERALGLALKAPRNLNPALSDAFERALVHGLEMKVNARPQSAREFYQEIVGNTPVPRPTGTLPAADSPVPPAPPTTPTPASHIARVQQIAREINPSAAVQTDKLICPVCRSTAMADSARSIRCPICRSAVLKHLVPSSDRLRCPSCRRGELAAVGNGLLRPDAVMRCPACEVGSVVGYMRQQMLVLPDAWARCDNCGADFDYHLQDDSLTLAELPTGAGRLSRNMLGETRNRREWNALTGTSADQYRCRECRSQFNSCGPGRLEWVAQGGRRDRVPSKHRGECLPRVDWAKIAHNVPLDDGTVACPSCDAQFDEIHPGQLSLLRASRDPHGILAAHRGRTYSTDTWRSLSYGRTGASGPGYICTACTAELEKTGYQQEYTLVAFDDRRDPHRTGYKYHNRQLTRADWQRVSAGKVPVSEEHRLREEAHRELWLALCSGEISPAEQSFPKPRRSDEKVVVTFAAVQIRSRLGFFYEHDDGQIWLTSERLLYRGTRGDVEIPLNQTTGCELHDVMQGYGAIVAIRRASGRSPFYFGMDSGVLELTIEGLDLQLPWDENSFAQLYTCMSP